LVLGVTFAVVFWLFYRVALFLTGSMIGYMFSDAILPGRMIYTIPTAAFFGIVTIFIERALLIILTAFFRINCNNLCRLCVDKWRDFQCIIRSKSFNFRSLCLAAVFPAVAILAREEGSTKS
jgi:hypothetical protein